jgi:hypothetical protein
VPPHLDYSVMYVNTGSAVFICGVCGDRDSRVSMASQRFVREAAVEPNPATMTEVEYREHVRKKQAVEHAEAAERTRQMEERIRVEKKNRRAAEMTERSQRLLKQRLEAAEAHVRCLPTTVYTVI